MHSWRQVSQIAYLKMVILLTKSDIWKLGFISTVRPTVHTLYQARKLEKFEYDGFGFSCERYNFENGTFWKLWPHVNYVISLPEIYFLK